MAKIRTGLHPLAYMGVEPTSPPLLVSKSVAPTTNNSENFNIGTIWIDTTTNTAYMLTDLSAKIATWINIGSTGDLTVTGNVGSATSVGNVMSILGDGVLSTSGAAATLTLSVTNGTDGQILIGGGANAAWATITSTDGSLTFTPGANSLVIEGTDATETQEGVVELATDAEAIAGTDTVRAIVPTSLKAKLGTQTDHGVLVGSGTTAALTALAVGTDGQLLIGGTAADPAFATLTSTGGTITFTPGANSLNLESVGGGGAVDFVTDAGTATVVGTTINVLGGTNINTSGAGSTVTINLDASPSVAGSITAGTGLTATTGGLTTTGTNTLNDLTLGIVASSAAGVLSNITGTNGQIIVGATGAAPIFATLGSTDGSITITPGINTLVVEGTAATELQVGSVELATDAEAIAGTDTSRAIVPSSLKAKLGTQTDHGMLVGSGTTAALTALAVGTNGQLLIGSTGADPVFATVTSTDGTITFTPGAGSLIIEGTDATETQEGVVELATDAEAIAGTDTVRAIVPTSLKAKLGTQTDHGVLVGASDTAAITALSVGTDGQLLIGATGADPAFATLTSGGGTITITPGPNSLNLETALGGFTWNDVTGISQAMAVGNGYVTNNASQVTCTLPATAAFGSKIRVAGYGAGGWKIAQNAGQEIIFGIQTTTTGAGGYLESTQISDGIELLCVVADTKFSVLSSIGNITVV